jgi:hypothetical protein
MNDDVRHHLVDHFADSTAALSEFLGRDLGAWQRA